ncbi:MAG: ATP-binding protein [Campylobacterota bacterium]|nr:ATP-binding protein [Campylobacterota bacterium]
MIKNHLYSNLIVLQKHEDGSLSFAGNIEEGQAVQFGFGDINHILNEKDKNFELALTYPIESIFIYSCMARRRLLDGFVSQEIRPYNKLAPTAGFFSNGEFYCCRYSQEYNLLNQSKTILFLSESDDISKRVKLDKIEQDSQTHRIEALTHLIKETSQELSDLNGRLNERVLEGIEKFKAIFDATQSIIFVIKDKRFYEANQSFMKFFDFLYPSTIERVECDLCHHFENYKPKNNYITKPYINGHYWLDYVIEHQDIQHKVAIKKVDQLYHFVVNVQKISNAKYVVELTDITKDITFQQEVKQKNKMLIQQSKMAQMGELLTMISHQWRQPLSAVASININLLIKNQMDVLDKSYLDEKLLEGDQYIKFLNQTIDDFKQFFRSDIDKKETSFYQIIQNVNNIVEQSLIHHNITLHIDLDEEGLSFKTYENDLQQVGLNIISNAKDAIAESGVADGQIVVRSHAENNYCVLEISNNGGNIPKELKEKIFNPYFTTKPHKHGTGIGLYISKMIMDKLDSTIECQNREGGWCSFILKIKR